MNHLSAKWRPTKTALMEVTVPVSCLYRVVNFKTKFILIVYHTYIYIYTYIKYIYTHIYIMNVVIQL